MVERGTGCEGYRDDDIVKKYMDVLLFAYRRCRQMLSNVLGISPSTETEALARSISSS